MRIDRTKYSHKKISKLLSTIQGRMVLLYGLLFLAAFVFINIAVNQLTGSFLLSSRVESQIQPVETIATHLGAATANQNADTLYNQVLSASKEIDGRVLVLDSDGVVMMDSYATLTGRLLMHDEVQAIKNNTLTVSYGYHLVDSGEDSFFQRGKKWAVYFTTPIVYKARNVGILLVSVSIQDVMDMITKTQTEFVIVSIAILGSLILISLLIARWISRPIVQMTTAIRAMSHGDFREKVKISGASEVAEMARTFNHMGERLNNMESQRREFIANASHELKTPLSSIKILTESLLYQENVPEQTYKEFLTDINEQIDRLNSLLSDLLTLAQTENAALVVRKTWENIDNIIAECVHSLEPLAAEKKVEIQHIRHETFLMCDRLKFSTALMNLLSNGVKFTLAGGYVRIETTVVMEEEPYVEIVVSDTGIGIPLEDQSHVFERFYRVDRARSRDTGGTGLGLAIVQQVVRLHGGEIRIDNDIKDKDEKIGTVFIITLPQGRKDA